MVPEIPLKSIGVLRLRYNHGNELAEIPVEDLQLVVEESRSDITCISDTVPVFSVPVSRTYRLEAKVIDNITGYHEVQQYNGYHTDIGYSETVISEDIDRILSSLVS